MEHSYPYIASLTREPFLFYEMRSTAKLMSEGFSDDAIVKEIVELLGSGQVVLRNGIAQVPLGRVRDNQQGKGVFLLQGNQLHHLSFCQKGFRIARF